jgi:regulator of protease activity HflC (stomatin/prohibitin superfamily)
MACFTCVDQAEMGIVERLGKFSRTLKPGFSLMIPCIENHVGSVSTRVQQLDVACETKTKDNVFVQMVVSVQYTPLGSEQSFYDAFYKLTAPEAQMRSYVEDIVRSSVPKLILDDVFLVKEEIASDVKSSLSDSMSSFGYEIVETLVTDVRPDRKVRDAMNDINAQRRLRVAAQDKAEAEKLLIVKAAEPDAESKYLAGLGVARQRAAIVNGLRESVISFSNEVEGTTSAQVMDMMVLTQYFDMLRDVGSKGHTTIVMSQNPGAMADIARELRGGFLTAASSAPSAQIMH